MRDPGLEKNEEMEIVEYNKSLRGRLGESRERRERWWVVLDDDGNPSKKDYREIVVLKEMCDCVPRSCVVDITGGAKKKMSDTLS